MSQTTTPNPPELLTVMEFADMIRKTEQGARWLIHTGKAPRSAVIGGRRLFRRQDVEQWIAAQFDDSAA